VKIAVISPFFLLPDNFPSILRFHHESAESVYLFNHLTEERMIQVVSDYIK